LQVSKLRPIRGDSLTFIFSAQLDLGVEIINSLYKCDFHAVLLGRPVVFKKNKEEKYFVANEVTLFLYQDRGRIPA